MTDPVQVEVALADSSGLSMPFVGTVSLQVGRSRTSPVSVSSADGDAFAAIPTTNLNGGSASLLVTLTSAGHRVSRSTVRNFIVIPPSFAVAGFGCNSFTGRPGRITWQVTVLNGVPVDHPADVNTVRPPVILDSDGRPLTTSGTVTITAGARKVVVLKVPSRHRRMLFSVPWNGRVRGSLRAGTYLATLQLKDAHGRTATASEHVSVARSGIAPRCM